MPAPTRTLQEDPPEGSRKVVDRELKRQAEKQQEDHGPQSRRTDRSSPDVKGPAAKTGR